MLSAQLKLKLHDVIYSRNEGLFRKAILLPLLLLSYIYVVVLKIRNLFYYIRIFKTRSLPCKVISIGNITLGGTGKTPSVIYLAELIKESFAKRVAILSRGYKGTNRSDFTVISDGKCLLLDADISGDEPYLIAKSLKNTPVLIGPDRYLSGKFALENFKVDTIIMDDGLQYLSLKRDINIVLIDGTNPFGNGYCFPRGILRESVTALKRSDVIWLTRVNESYNVDEVSKYINKINPLAIKVESIHKPTSLLMIPNHLPLEKGGCEDLKELGLEYLRGKRVLAFSGIVNVNSFINSLKANGAGVIGVLRFPDHHNFSLREIEEIDNMASKDMTDLIITTEKDFVRIPEGASFKTPFAVLKIKLVVTKGLDDLKECIKDVICKTN